MGINKCTCLNRQRNEKVYRGPPPVQKRPAYDSELQATEVNWVAVNPEIVPGENVFDANYDRK